MQTNLKIKTEELNRRLAWQMLHVILGSNPEGIEKGARAWDRDVVIDDIDYGVIKLIPLYFLKLKEAGIVSTYDKRLKVLYKYWWLKTLKNRDRLREVVEILNLRQIEVMVIKGASILSFYKDAVLRPMADFDVLVPKHQVLGVLELLEKEGWEISEPFFYKNLKHRPDLCMDFRHSIELVHQAEKTKMDLHWKVGNYGSWELTQQVWDSSLPSDQFDGAKIPSTRYQLVMGILHSVDSESKDHYNWMIDIALMIPFLSGADWEFARDCAVSEKKSDWFDYGIYLLKKVGLDVPQIEVVTNPPQGRLTKSEFGVKANLPRYLWKKIKNNMIILDINFPHDSKPKRLKRMIDRLRYFSLNRGIH
jgi:hypothetical protein